MRKVSFILACTGILTLSACGENKQDNQTEETVMPMQNDTRMPVEGHGDHMQGQQGNLDDGAQTGQIGFKDEDMKPVYQHYMHIKTALVNSNAEEAQNGGKMTMEALENLDDGEQAMDAARTIAESQDINTQRTAFLDLSSAMEDMMDGALASGELYKQYCPMAFEGEGGAWLSASQEVRNPYYGDKMLKCGSVRETIR